MHNAAGGISMRGIVERLRNRTCSDERVTLREWYPVQKVQQKMQDPLQSVTVHSLQSINCAFFAKHHSAKACTHQ